MLAVIMAPAVSWKADGEQVRATLSSSAAEVLLCPGVVHLCR